MSNTTYHMKRIFIKVVRLVLYGSILMKIYTNWDMVLQSRKYIYGCRALFVLMGIAILECLINIFYHIFTITDEPKGDVFVFPVVLVPLLIIAGWSPSKTRLNSEEKMVLRETFREYDRYKAGDNVHNYYKKNGRL